MRSCGAEIRTFISFGPAFLISFNNRSPNPVFFYTINILKMIPLKTKNYLPLKRVDPPLKTIF